MKRTLNIQGARRYREAAPPEEQEKQERGMQEKNLSQGHNLRQAEETSSDRIRRNQTMEEARQRQEETYLEAARAALWKKQEREREKQEKKWARYEFLNTHPGYTLHQGDCTPSAVRSTLNDAQKDVEMKQARMKLQEKYNNCS